jgi:hypothetical protein
VRVAAAENGRGHKGIVGGGLVFHCTVGFGTRKCVRESTLGFQWSRLRRQSLATAGLK